MPRCALGPHGRLLSGDRAAGVGGPCEPRVSPQLAGLAPPTPDPGLAPRLFPHRLWIVLLVCRCCRHCPILVLFFSVVVFEHLNILEFANSFLSQAS